MILVLHHLALVLEGLEALSARDAQALERCCDELDKADDQALSGSAEQLRRLAQTLDQA